MGLTDKTYKGIQSLGIANYYIKHIPGPQAKVLLVSGTSDDTVSYKKYRYH